MVASADKLDGCYQERSQKLEYNLSKLGLDNEDVWLCLLKERGELDYKFIEELKRGYRKNPLATVSELAGIKHHSLKGRSLLDYICFGYDLESEKFEQEFENDAKDLHCSTLNLAVRDGERILIAPHFGKTYAENIEILFQRNVIPHLTNDEIVVVGESGMLRPKSQVMKISKREN